MNDETALADTLAFVLSGRPERLTDATVARMPTEQRSSLGAVVDMVASLGRAEAPVAPSVALRDRVLETFRARRAQTIRRALLVVEMIRDNMMPGRPLEVPRARAIVPALAKRLEAARSAGMPIVYVVDRHAADDPELDTWGFHAVEGTEGAKVWPDLAPTDGDRVVTKPSYSGFHASNLERVLDELAVDTLILTGCATEVQLMATATDALERGFAVELPADCQAGISETGERVVLGVISVLAPHAPARHERLARIAKNLAADT
ncbi:MAG TPA: isochorismatase family cysteine hydrolase [Polyangiaceae bacterium]|nr:isochorismatase family cysteine hydrolase [Polyangiaceae bacterium]